MNQEPDRWSVVLQELISGEKIWAVSNVVRVATREEACQWAEHLARTHRPRHPLRSGTRTAMRLVDGSWLVTVQGTVRNYHFRVDIGYVPPWSD